MGDVEFGGVFLVFYGVLFVDVEDVYDAFRFVIRDDGF